MWALLLLLVACAHVEANPDEDVCQREAELRGAECATVYEFAMQSRAHLGNVELCVPERYLADAEAKHGPSWPSDDERFTKYTQGLVDPPCFWCASPGANALDGCFIPEAL